MSDIKRRNFVGEEQSKDLIDTPKAAKLLGCTRQRIVQLVHAGQLKAIRKGQFWFISKACVLARREEGTGANAARKKCTIKRPVTPKEAAQMGGVSRAWIHRLIYRGILDAETVCGYVFVPRAAVRRWIRGRKFKTARIKIVSK